MMVVSPRLRAALILIFKAVVSIALIMLLVRYVGTDGFQRVINRANPFLLALGCACSIGQMALTTVKWRLLLTGEGVNVAFRHLFQMQLAGQFVNLFMPSVLGGDAYRAVKLRAHTGSLHTALPSVLVDRATGLIALLLIGTTGLVHMYAPNLLWGAIVLLAVVTAAGYWLLIGPAAKWLRRLPDAGAWGVIKIAKRSIDSARPSRVLLYVALISLIFQFNVVWITGIYAVAVGITADLWHLVIAVPASNVIEMIPISVSGIGVREASYTVMFKEMQLAAADGLALGLTISVMRYVTGLVCGVALLVKSAPDRQALSTEVPPPR